jgi:hypothetical protein
MDRSCNNLKNYLTQGGKVISENKEPLLNESGLGAERKRGDAANEKILDVIHSYIKTL